MISSRVSSYFRAICSIVFLLFSHKYNAQSIQDYKQEALENNSKIQALRKQPFLVETYQKEKTTWESTEVYSGIFTGDPGISNGILQGVAGISQKVPILGYQRNQKEIVNIHVKIAENAFEIQQRKFFLKLEKVYYDLYQYKAKIKVYEDHQAFLKEFIVKFQSDTLIEASSLVLRQIEEEELQQQVEILKGTLLNAEATFNQMLGRDGFDPLIIPDNFFMPEEEPTLLLDDITFHPELLFFELNKELRQSEFNLHKKHTLSSLTLGFNYFIVDETVDDFATNGQDIAMPYASISFPLFSKKNQIVEKKLMANEEKDEFDESYITSHLQHLLETAVNNRITARISYTSNQKILEQLTILKSNMDNENLNKVFEIETKIFEYKLKSIEAITNYFKQTATFNYLQ